MMYKIKLIIIWLSPGKILTILGVYLFRKCINNFELYLKMKLEIPVETTAQLDLQTNEVPAADWQW